VSGRPTEEEQHEYANLLAQVKGRLGAAYFFLSDVGNDQIGGLLGRPYPMECAALQLRKVLELLLLGSLITNRSALSQSEKALSRKKADEASKLVEKLNPAFWPNPVRQAPGRLGASWQLKPVADGFLRREEYGRAFGLVSSWAHARNPLAAPLDPDRGRADLSNLEQKLRRLVNHFTVGLVDRDAMLVCQMSAFPRGVDMVGDGRVQVVLFERMAGMTSF